MLGGHHCPSSRNAQVKTCCTTSTCVGSFHHTKFNLNRHVATIHRSEVLSEAEAAPMDDVEEEEDDAISNVTTDESVATSTDVNVKTN